MSLPSIKALQGFPQTFLEVVWMFFSLWANIKPEAGIQLRNFSQNKSGSAGIWSCGPIMGNVWHLQQVLLLPVPPQCPVWDRNSVWPQDYLGLISLFPNQAPGALGFEQRMYQTQLIQNINQEYNGCFHSSRLGKFSCINSPKVKRLLFNVTIKQILWAFPTRAMWLLGCKTDRLASVQELSDYSVKNWCLWTWVIHNTIYLKT